MTTITLATLVDNQLVNPNGGSDVVQATVLDSSGAAVEGALVYWTNTGATLVNATSPLTTDANGQATAYFQSTKAGIVTVVAALNLSVEKSTIINFVSSKPVTTPVLPLSISLNVLTNNQPTGGAGQDRIVATVVDATGAAASGQKVTWSVDNGADLSTTANPGTTNSSGQVTAYISNTTAGDSNLTATLASGASATTVISFKDTTVTTPVGAMTISFFVQTNDSPADGYTPDSITAYVADSTPSSVQGQTVTWSIDNGATLDTTLYTNVTDSGGAVTVFAYSTTVGDANLTATLADGTSNSTVISFVEPSASTTNQIDDFKADVATFIAYIQQQLDDVSQNVNSALSQLSSSVTQSDVSSALAALKTNDATFNSYVSQNIATLYQNANAAVAELTKKYG